MPQQGPNGHAENELHLLAFLEELDHWLINAHDVKEDLDALRAAYPDPEQHWRAIQAIVHQMQVIPRRGPGKEMHGNYLGWTRRAFESHRQSGEPADLRIVYRVLGDGKVELLGFGHRHLPEDLYRRLGYRRRRT